MQTLLIHNDSAGAGQLAREELLTALESGGLTLRHCKPQDPALEQVLAEPSDLVVLAGGDGTIARILAKLPDTKRRVAIVPLGTANNIAQSLGILDSANAGSGNEIVTAWKHADIQRMDVGIVTGPWGSNRFIEAVGIGPLARTILQFKTRDVTAADSIRLGREAFRHALEHAAPVRSRVRLDGRILEGEHLLVEAMNIQHAGSRLRLAPAAEIGDGHFDVVTISPDQRAGMLAWIRKGSDEAPPLTVTRAAKVSIDWRGDPLRIDDYGPKAKEDEQLQDGPVEIGFVGQQLDILVPSLVDQQALAERITVKS